MTTTPTARRLGRARNPHNDRRSAGFDPAAYPILAQHWFGVEPLRPIGSTNFPVVRRFESPQGTADVPT